MAHTLVIGSAFVEKHLIREGTLWDGRASHKVLGGLDYMVQKRSVCTTQAVKEHLRTVELHTSPSWRILDGASAGKAVTQKGVHKTCCECG